jgi:hypothetical protein
MALLRSWPFPSTPSSVVIVPPRSNSAIDRGAPIKSGTFCIFATLGKVGNAGKTAILEDDAEFLPLSGRRAPSIKGEIRFKTYAV